MEKKLIIVTRLMKGSRRQDDKEFEKYWKKWFAKIEETELTNINQTETIKIKYGRKETNRNHMIVISGDDIDVDRWNDQQLSYAEYYSKNEVLLFMIKFIKNQLKCITQDDRVLMAFHWNNDKKFFIESNRWVEENILGDNKGLFEWPEGPNIAYLNYTLGGHNSILPQVRGMVNSLENNLAGFDEAFDDLWGGIKGSYTILHMVSILLGYLKVQLYDAGQSPQDIKNKEEIIRSIKYLCTGEQSNNILQEAKKILTRREENLKDWILSDFDWGKKANKTLEEYLANLPSYIENYKPNEFISFCSKFRNFIQDIAIGKKPEKIDVD